MNHNNDQHGILIIYSALRLGGIETFFVRLAKERHKKGLNTYILLHNINKSNEELLLDAKRYAELIDINTLLKGPFRKLSKILPISLMLMMGFPLLCLKKTKTIFKKSSIIHVTKPKVAHFVLRTLDLIGIRRAITVGFYHTNPFKYIKDRKYPYHEEKCFDLIINELPKKNLVIFNDKLPLYFKEKYNLDYYGASTFPLGVIDRTKLSKRFFVDIKSSKPNKNTLKICSIGRIVDSKTYNIWMLEVVKDLTHKGLKIQYDIYGEGSLKPRLQEELTKKGITNVRFCGEIPYSKFGETVQKYDLFVGSGTAIVEASANGIPSIIGIEYITKPKTYGFFSKIEGFTYNERGLHPTVCVSTLIEDFVGYTHKKIIDLKKDHIEKASLFTIEQCSENFENLENNAKVVNSDIIKYNSFYFILSYFYHGITKRLGIY